MYLWGEDRAAGRVGSDFLSAIAGRVGSRFRRVGSGPRKVTRGQLGYNNAFQNFNIILDSLWQLHSVFTRLVCGFIQGSSQAGAINTHKSESSPPDLFQIVTTTLLSVICLLLLVVFVAFVIRKCFRGELRIYTASVKLHI